MNSLEADALKLAMGTGATPQQQEAAAYLRKRGLHAGSVSTLRKIMRAQRIAAGERLRAKLPARRQIGRVGFVLLPTKGWRRA